MKRNILTSLALVAVTAVWGQNTAPMQLVVTDNDENKTFFSTEDLEMVIFQPTPDYMNLPLFTGGSYEETSETGLYRINFATATPDAQGMPAAPGDITMSLQLLGPWSDKVSEPILPEGYYRIGNGKDLFTFDAVKSAVYFRAAQDAEVNPMMIIDGTVDVRKDGNDYDVRIEITTFEGLSLDCRYRGAIDLPAGAGEFTPISEPVELTFNGAQGRFYGNWFYPFAADLSMQLWAGELSPEGYLTEGYILYLDFSEPKPEDENAARPRVADGTYLPENREAFAYTYLPFTFNKGELTDFLGSTVITKTRIEYFGADGSRKLGLLTGGSFTVSENGTVFEFDFTTEDGVSIKGSYKGIPNIQNFCDNDEKAPKRPYSTLKGNRTLKFPADAVAMSYNDGKTILSDLNTLTLMITALNMDHGDYIQIDLLSDKEIFSDGTYTMTWTLGNGNMIPGALDYGGQMMFSWYGDLDTTDEEGYQTDLACLSEGTVTMTTNSDKTVNIKMDLTDDAGYKISGEYNGVLINLNDYEQTGAPGKMPKRGTKKMRLIRN